MASACDNDWQSTKKTVLERNTYMFNNPLMSDIKFTCGESKRKYFYAHKYVLATSSAVFYSMFYGRLAEKDSIIHIPDTDEESFEEFLRFLYTDHCTMTAEVAVKVMYLAKKYIVPSLTEKCVEVLQESLQPDNVVTVLEQAVHFDEKELEEKCWKMIDSNTGKVVASDAFCRISHGTLINILKRDNLNGIEEIELFKAVLKWIDTQCEKNGLEATAENKRAVIGDALYEIRFPSMSQKEFGQYVSRSGLLTPEEVVSIYDKFTGLQSPALPWKQPGRRPLDRLFPKRFTRFNVDNICAPRSGSWVYRNMPDLVCFSVNKPATFHGVYLFGDDKGSEYEVSMDVGDVKITGNYTSQRNSEGVYGFNVMLPTPIPLEQNNVVAMAVMMDGPNSYCGRNGKESVDVDGVIVTFSNGGLGRNSNGTNKTQGQFYEIILSTRR